MNIEKLRELNIRETKEKIKKSITNDLVIIQAVRVLDELEKSINRLNVAVNDFGYFSKDNVKSYKDMIEELEKLKEEQVKYIEGLASKFIPNLAKEATAVIAARLLDIAGGLKRIALMPSSTVQLLGAEKALFRHLRKKTLPPKFGILVHHPLVSGAKQKDKGRIARRLAGKIAIAAKKDYFRK